MLRWIGKLLLALVVLVAVTVLVLGGYRTWRQHEAEQALTIAGANGIDEGLFVDVRGGKQWITIRSTDARHPVLLVVHGGPGAAMSPLAGAFLPYEREWTVVQWDQPGAGRTFSRAGNTLPGDTTVATIAADGVAITELVAKRLGKQKVVLLGVSFGSVVGLMVHARPELYSAYVGTGLFVHRDDGRAVALARLLTLARARHDAAALAELEPIGPAPFEPREVRALNRWADALTSGEGVAANDRLAELVFVPRQSLRDVVGYFGGYLASDEHFDLGAMDLRKHDATFAVPIVVIQGGEDYDTPIELARGYFDSVSAPRKEFVTLPRGGHTVLIDDAASFVAELHEHVLPLAL